MDREAALLGRHRAWALVLLAVTTAGLACGGAAPENGAPVSDGGTKPPDTGPPDPWPPPPGRWEKLTPIPDLPRFYVGMAAARGKLFVVGGVAPGRFDNGLERTAVHAYDPSTDRWEKMPSLPKPLIMPNVVAVGDQLLVLGALDVRESYAFDFDRRIWTPRAPMPVERGPGGAAIGVWGTGVLLAGGAVRGQSGNMLNTGMRQAGVFAYSTETNEWVTYPDLPVAVGYAAGAVIGNKFYVMGGSTDFARTDQVLVLDIMKGVWDTGVNLPVSISSATAAVIRGRIVVTGGIATESGALSPNTVVFNPDKGEWATVAELPTKRFSHGAAMLDGRLYVATGLGMVPTAAMYGVVPDLEVFIP
jgi:hypothetical protein